MNDMFDFSEFVKRAIKYLVEGIMVAIAAFVIPQKALRLKRLSSLHWLPQRHSVFSMYLSHPWLLVQEVVLVSVLVLTWYNSPRQCTPSKRLVVNKKMFFL